MEEMGNDKTHPWRPLTTHQCRVTYRTREEQLILDLIHSILLDPGFSNKTPDFTLISKAEIVRLFPSASKHGNPRRHYVNIF